MHPRLLARSDDLVPRCAHPLCQRGKARATPLRPHGAQDVPVGHLRRRLLLQRPRVVPPQPRPAPRLIPLARRLPVLRVHLRVAPHPPDPSIYPLRGREPRVRDPQLRGDSERDHPLPWSTSEPLTQPSSRGSAACGASAPAAPHRYEDPVLPISDRPAGIDPPISAAESSLLVSLQSLPGEGGHPAPRSAEL